MPAKVTPRPSTRVRLAGLQLGATGAGPAVDRAREEITTAVQRLEDLRQARSLVVADLVIGQNVVNHGLGRPPKHCQVTPTVCSAAFAFALVAADTLTATIEVVGIDQPGAGLEFG